MKSARVKLDHVYFVRIVERDGTENASALLHVVDFKLGESVRLQVVQL